MRKITLFVTAVLTSMTSFSQAWGDSYISGMIGISGGSQATILKGNGQTNTEYQPLDSGFGIGVEYAYFLEDKLRVAVCLGASSAFNPYESTDYGWLENNAFSVGINPNIAYYVRLTDNLYYAPEVGLSLEYGSMKLQLTGDDSYSRPIWGCTTYVHLLAFEFEVSEKIALGISMFSIDYTSITFRDNTIGYSYKTNQKNYNLNDAVIDFRYYF